MFSAPTILGKQGTRNVRVQQRAAGVPPWHASGGEAPPLSSNLLHPHLHVVVAIMFAQHKFHRYARGEKQGGRIATIQIGNLRHWLCTCVAVVPSILDAPVFALRASRGHTAQRRQRVNKKNTECFFFLLSFFFFLYLSDFLALVFFFSLAQKKESFTNGEHTWLKLYTSKKSVNYLTGEENKPLARAKKSFLSGGRICQETKNGPRTSL